MKIKFLCLFLMFSAALSYGQVNSVLSEGSWYKIAVPDKGVYKIDRSFLENLGISTAGIDPRNIAIYGNAGGGMLPQSNAASRPEDLTENSILVVGENDGVFNNGDYILFYANSTDHLEFRNDIQAFEYENNLYADSTTYFITLKNSPAKRIQLRANAGNEFPITNSFYSVIIHEIEQTNLIQAGRRWFGERFLLGGGDLELDFTSDNVVEGSEIRVIASLMSQAFSESSFDLELNNLQLGRVIMDSVIDDTYKLKGDIKNDTFNIDASTVLNGSNQINLDISFNPAATGNSTGFLDYLLIQSENELIYDNGLHIFSPSNVDNQTYEISNAQSGMMIWDISDPTNVVQQDYDLNGSIGSFGTEKYSSKFILFEDTGIPSPASLGEINNQNLRGLSSVDALFITHPIFLSEAQRLADFRSQRDGLSIHVVTIDQVYNEFSSGMQDVSAIRDFAKYHYDTHSQDLKYLLLFGDCSYDYKFRSINDQNFVPVYEARNSLDPIESFSSDDYFGFMEDSEGDWNESRAGDHTMELGVGRLPVKTLDEARNVVNKIIRYQTSVNAFGSWRNDIVFVADDGDQNIHQRDANRLAVYVDTVRREFNVHKIYLDAFDQIPTPNGEKSPDASEAIKEAIANGSLMINYTGHGNESQLAHEDIIDETVIGNLTNRLKLPFFITATCDFGTYDNPLIESAGESIILNSNGGAIALLTTTRPVFSNTNFILNRAYYFASLSKENGKYPRLGDIVRNTKNTSLSGPVNRNFALLGDPTMRIAFPEYEIDLTSINGLPIESADTLRALGQVNVEGEIQDNQGNRITGFDGIVSVKVLDKETEFITKGNESDAPPKIYTEREVLLFQGDATVTDGQFSFDFIVPKNISYVFGEGKISLYAVNENKNLDAHGANSDLIVGGSNANALIDNEAPDLDVYLNDSTFRSGQSVGPDPVLLAKLSDLNGINISSAGFGQDITATLDDEQQIILNQYYNASINTFQEGWVVYELSGISTGKHTLTFSAFDTHGNESQATIEFFVNENSNLLLRDVRNFPNPFSEETTFTFTHDRAGEGLNISLNIINLEGRVITKKTYRFDDSPETIDTIHWDGRDAHGNRTKKGIYIYKIVIQSTLDGAKNEVFGKLVVFN